MIMMTISLFRHRTSSNFMHQEDRAVSLWSWLLE